MILPGYIALVIGGAAMIMQVLLLREFLAIFSGNELIIGTILANWLLITGIAALLAKYIRNVTTTKLSLTLIICACYQPLSVFLIRYIKGQFFPGVAVGLTTSLVFSFLILLPFCVCSAVILTSLPRLISNNRAPSVSYIYFSDTLGALLGSIIFTFFLSINFPSLQVAILLSIILVHAAIILLIRDAPKFAAFLSFIFIIAILVLLTIPKLFNPLELKTLSYIFPQQEITNHINTPYGQLIFSKNGNQLTVYQNGRVIGAENDSILAEEMVHYPLSQHPLPQTILLVGGGLNGSLLELSKYSLQKIDYIDIDISVIKAAQDLYKSNLSDRLSWIDADIIQFLANNNNRYDIIVVNSPSPDSAQANRYYTKEFFKSAKNHLNPNGILSISIPRSDNYISNTHRIIASSIYNSLKVTFKNLIVVPGEKLYFIASEHKLDSNIALSLKNKNIYTTYVNENYLRGILTADRLQSAQDAFTIKNLYNSNQRPITYLVQIKHWLEQFEDNILTPILIILTCIISLIFIISRAPASAFYLAFSVSSMATLGLELVLLIAIQIIYGSLYQQTGLVFAAFMLGAAIGSSVCSYKTPNVKQWFFLLDLTIIAIAVMLGAAMQVDSFTPSQFLLYGLTALSGITIGGQFGCLCQLVANVGKNNDFISTTIFAVDFIAAAVGALLVGSLLIPLFGLTNVAFMIAGVKFIVFVIVSYSNVDSQQSAGKFSHLLTMLVFVAFGIGVILETSNTFLYHLSFHPLSQTIILLLFVAGIIGALKLSWLKRWFSVSFFEKCQSHTGLGFFHWLCFFGIGGTVFYPIFRCFFKVPYIFCHGCPHKCIFGHLRPYMVPAALTINLENRLWCYQMCPLGTLQECQSHSRLLKKRFFRFLALTPYLVLLFTILGYILIDKYKSSSPGTFADSWFNYFIKSNYSVSYLVIGGVLCFVILGYAFRRSFCSLFCPIGIFSELIFFFQRKVGIISKEERSQGNIENDD